MTETEANIPDDLPVRLDNAIQALYCGDGSKLEQLVGSESGAGPAFAELLSPLLATPATSIVGLPSGTVVRGYTIRREIGRGGMGIVYEAEQHEPRRTVALKVLHGPASDEQRSRLFQREIQTLARLRHPGIVTIHEAGKTHDGRYFFTMELVAGQPLNKYVRMHRLSLRERLELFVKVCEAVAHAHDNGVIHRDLKPSNIVVDVDGHPRIVDFGLARLTDAEATLTLTAGHSGLVLGSLAYMSPEQARGEHAAVDERTDVYALGMILYELLTGCLAYELGANLAEAIQTICRTAPRPLSALQNDMPTDIQKVVLQALEKEPAHRYQSVHSLVADVQRFLSGEPVLAQRSSSLRALARRLARRRTHAPLTGIAALLIAGLLSVLSWREYAWSRVQERERAAARRELIHVQDCLERGLLEEALGRAMILRARCPTLPEALLVYAQADFRRPQGLGRYGAISEVTREVLRDPTHWECAALLADFYRRTDDLEQAAHWDAQAGRLMPDTAEAWYVRSFTTLDLAQAASFAREAARRDPTSPAAWERLARVSLLTNNFEDTLIAAEHLTALEPWVIEWLWLKPHALIRQGRPAEALAEYDRLVGRPECHPRAYRERAHVCRRLGRHDQAIADYSRALEVPTDDAQRAMAWVRYYRAIPLWISGRPEEAANDLRSARPALGRYSYADARLYILLRDEQKDAEATELLRRAQRDANQGDRWLSRILACLAGELTPDDLIAYALERDDPEHVCEAYYYAGEATRLTGDLQRARAYFEQCLKTGVQFDLQAFPAPMSEYDLAEWRLKQLTE